MKIGQMIDSKYLKGSDVDPAKLLTVRSFKKENVAKENEPEERKWIVYFDGVPKGLILNKTNLNRAARAFGSEDTDDWIGKQIVVYYDPDVEFGGKIVGGIRLRAPKLPSQRIEEASNRHAPISEESASPLTGAAAARAQMGRAPHPQAQSQPPPREEDDPGYEDDIPF